MDPSKVIVTAGEHNIIEDDGTEQIATALQVKVHEDYDR